VEKAQQIGTWPSNGMQRMRNRAPRLLLRAPDAGRYAASNPDSQQTEESG